MPVKPNYKFIFNIKEGMTKKAETQKANMLWKIMKNQAPYNRKDKVQVLLHLTRICSLMLQLATDYWQDETDNNGNEGYIQHFDPDC